MFNLSSLCFLPECYPRDVWHQVDGRCYYISQTEMNFSEGKIKCQNLGKNMMKYIFHVDSYARKQQVPHSTHLNPFNVCGRCPSVFFFSFFFLHNHAMNITVNLRAMLQDKKFQLGKCHLLELFIVHSNFKSHFSPSTTPARAKKKKENPQK